MKDTPGTHTQPEFPGLSLEVKPNRFLAELPDGGELYGSIKVSGALPVHTNLDDGDKVVVTVTDADGQVLCASEATITPPSFKAVTVPKIGRVGTERVHTAKLGHGE